MLISEKFDLLFGRDPTLVIDPKTKNNYNITMYYCFIGKSFCDVLCVTSINDEIWIGRGHDEDERNNFYLSINGKITAERKAINDYLTFICKLKGI